MMWSNKTQIKKKSASFLGKYNYRVIGGNKKKGLRAWPPIPAEMDFLRSSLSHDKKSQSHKKFSSQNWDFSFEIFWKTTLNVLDI